MDLPQPTMHGARYKYLTYDEIPSLFSSLQNSTTPSSSSALTVPQSVEPIISLFKYDTLVWVLLSKGKGRGGRSAELYRRARVLNVLCSLEATSNSSTYNNRQDEPRVLVQYPLGSTYSVRSTLLIPGTEKIVYIV